MSEIGNAAWPPAWRIRLGPATTTVSCWDVDAARKLIATTDARVVSWETHIYCGLTRSYWNRNRLYVSLYE
jgi:hypothetical protein